MKEKPKLILRTYRITLAHDKFIKRQAKKWGGESAFIRNMVEEWPKCSH